MFKHRKFQLETDYRIRDSKAAHSVKFPVVVEVKSNEITRENMMSNSSFQNVLEHSESFVIKFVYTRSGYSV